MNRSHRVVIQWIQFSPDRMNADDGFDLVGVRIHQTMRSREDRILVDEHAGTTPAMTRISEQRDHPRPRHRSEGEGEGELVRTTCARWHRLRL